MIFQDGNERFGAVNYNEENDFEIKMQVWIFIYLLFFSFWKLTIFIVCFFFQSLKSIGKKCALWNRIEECSIEMDVEMMRAIAAKKRLNRLMIDSNVSENVMKTINDTEEEKTKRLLNVWGVLSDLLNEFELKFVRTD